MASEECISEQHVGKDAEQNGRDIIQNNIPEFVLNTEEHHDQPQL